MYPAYFTNIAIFLCIFVERLFQFCGSIAISLSFLTRSRFLVELRDVSLILFLATMITILRKSVNECSRRRSKRDMRVSGPVAWGGGPPELKIDAILI